MEQETYNLVHLLTSTLITLGTVGISVLALKEAQKARRLSFEPILCPKIICHGEFYYLELINLGKGQIFDLAITSKNQIIKNMKSLNIRSLPTQNRVMLLITSKQAISNLRNKTVKIDISYSDQFNRSHILKDLEYDLELVNC